MQSTPRKEIPCPQHIFENHQESLPFPPAICQIAFPRFSGHFFFHAGVEKAIKKGSFPNANRISICV
jgi:hypothetical protein